MRILSIALVVAGLLTTASSATGQPSVPYDHVHLAVADPEKAEAWYTANLNGNVGENPGRIAFQPWSNRAPLPIQFIFLKAEDAKPSEGSVIDSVGFVVQGLEAKVKVLEAAGATLRQPVESVPGLGKHAVVIDPWGTKIELVESRDRPGFHHITLRVSNPEASINWYLRSFGGERTKLGGRLDAVKYGNTYLIVTRGDATTPSRGRAIDHLGFGPRSMDAMAADLKTKGVAFTAEPAAKPNQFGHRTAYVEDPSGVRIELVEHAQCAAGQASRESR
jgi:catechol 2,3-dioxygenase-like lactoylglutathione lyase family enzyme